MVALFVWTPVVWHWEGTCLGMAVLCKHTRNTETRCTNIDMQMCGAFSDGTFMLIYITCQSWRPHIQIFSWRQRQMAFYSRCLTWWLQSIFVEMMTVSKIPPMEYSTPGCSSLKSTKTWRPRLMAIKLRYQNVIKIKLLSYNFETKFWSPNLEPSFNSSINRKSLAMSKEKTNALQICIVLSE